MSDTRFLADEDGAILLRLARHAIQRAAEDRSVDEETPSPTPALLGQRGVFVTLWKSGRLRGCIGHMRDDRPLFEAVQTAAESAALRDPRFPAVRVEELSSIALSVSVLTKPERVEDPSPNAVEVGRHGLWVVHEERSGVLLPDVPARLGWDALTFLGETCRKANLPGDAWRWPKSRLYRFEAQVFKEASAGHVPS